MLRQPFEVSCRFSIQRDSCVTVAKAMSSSFAGRELGVGAAPDKAILPRHRRSTPGSMGSHRVAGRQRRLQRQFPRPVRRSYTAASVLAPTRRGHAHVPRRSAETGPAFRPPRTWSSKPPVRTPDPRQTPAARPAASCEDSARAVRDAAAAPSTPSDVTVKKSLRDLDINSPVFSERSVESPNRVVCSGPSDLGCSRRRSLAARSFVRLKHFAQTTSREMRITCSLAQRTQLHFLGRDRHLRRRQFRRRPILGVGLDRNRPRRRGWPARSPAPAR